MPEDKKINIPELAKKAALMEKLSDVELSAWIQIFTREVYECQDQLDKLNERLDKLKDI